MAEKPEGLSQMNFSIEETLEMGAGNQELLQGLMDPESVTGDGDGLEPIVKTVEDTTTQRVQTTDQTTTLKTTEETTTRQPNKDIEKFLYGDEEEEEEEEETPPAPPASQSDEGEEGEGGDQPSVQFSALAKDLFNLGIFTPEEGEEDVEIDTPEAFLERFELEKKKSANQILENFLGQFGEEYQRAFEAIYLKGVNPRDYFGTMEKVSNFAQLDMSVEANQEKVVRQALMEQEFDTEDIDAEVERLKSYGDLEDVSKRFHKVLIKKESKALEDKEREAQQKLQMKQQVRNEYIQNVTTILQEKLKSKSFDGLPINPSIANELQDFLLVEKYKTPAGETLTDFDRAILELKRPENHEKKVKIALLMRMLEKDPSLSALQKVATTKKVDKLFSEVARQSSGATKKSASTQSSPSKWFL